MSANREELLRTLIPPVVAVVLTLLFFALFNRWEKLADPINSIVTLVLGIVGFGTGALIDIQRANRGKASSSNTNTAAGAGGG